MPELPITHCKRLAKPDIATRSDRYQWRVGLDDVTYVAVELAGAEAERTGLGTTEFDAQVGAALQRFAASVLTDDRDVLDQVGGWNAPIVLTSEHFV